ncbi:uncharacterized protein LOC100215280 isoform X1 [Hydra vulgaris]|uniref:uncharacterized protein LOC100215280 isoform X1 n=1 Tax=Hydra vulgaris TaxID=6087 RepID=UPI001F5F392E|nr:uncharacterized protein LOC100215280 [Hydra vulgaris]
MLHKSIIFHVVIGIAFSDIISSISESSLYNVVSLLKKFDKNLNGRRASKKIIIDSGGSKCDLLQFADKFKSNGTAYTSQGTSDWILEIIEGFENLRNIQANEDNAEDFSNNNVINLFSNINNNESTANKEIIFEMKLVGPLQHSWIIHRLPDQRGYRIYQSVTNAYSLNAWLNTEENQFEYLWSKGDLMYWQDTYNKVEGLLNKTGNTLQNIEAIKPSMLWLKPWLTFVKELNKTRITSYFKNAWSRYGGGRIINEKDFFTNYLMTLSNMTSSIQRLVGTTKIWTSCLDRQWISLFGAANPLVYIGMPFQMMTHSKNPKPFKLLIRTIQVDETKVNDMDINANKLLQSVNFTVASFHMTGSSNNTSYSNYTKYSLFLIIFNLIVFLLCN